MSEDAHQLIEVHRVISERAAKHGFFTYVGKISTRRVVLSRAGRDWVFLGGREADKFLDGYELALAECTKVCGYNE